MSTRHHRVQKDTHWYQLSSNGNSVWSTSSFWCCFISSHYSLLIKWCYFSDTFIQTLTFFTKYEFQNNEPLATGRRMKLKVDWRPSEWAIKGFLWVCLCIEHIICFLWRHTDDLQLFLPLLHWYSDMFTNRKKIPFAYLFHGHFRNNTTVCFDASNQEYFKNWVIYQRNTSKNDSITLQLFPFLG